ncbi:MAG: hypothetical protein ACREO0_09295 [Pseudoxanthomonas sp.]
MAERISELDLTRFLGNLRNNVRQSLARMDCLRNYTPLPITAH